MHKKEKLSLLFLFIENIFHSIYYEDDRIGTRWFG